MKIEKGINKEENWKVREYRIRTLIILQHKYKSYERQLSKAIKMKTKLVFIYGFNFYIRGKLSVIWCYTSSDPADMIQIPSYTGHILSCV